MQTILPMILFDAAASPAAAAAASLQRSLRLCDLARGLEASVSHVLDHSPGDAVSMRLRDLGFVDGEPVRVVAHGPIGADPLLVQIGYTRFALRRAEAARVQVRTAA